jgi:hypothetical protein
MVHVHRFRWLTCCTSDIVDTTIDRSPMWKMLLGSIIGAVDNAADDCTEDVSG